MIKDDLKATGIVNIKQYNSTGNLIKDFTVNNLVVNSGIGFIISRMYSSTENPMSHMAIGGTFGSPVPSEATLGSEITRVALTSTTIVGNSIVFVATFGAGVGTGLIQEAGIFNAATSGTMLNRVSFGSVNKNSSDTIVITWTLTLG